MHIGDDYTDFEFKLKKALTLIEFNFIGAKCILLSPERIF